ncbi:MAG: zinc ribbon domain-containing protein [Clostridia bacterium]|nr:zinc ribbon domain-containing protein [Clostridia bacterium]
MKCLHCGFETNEEFAFCPNCGKASAEPQTDKTENMAVSINPVEDFVLRILKDKLFLAVCILVSGATIFAIANDNINVIGILMSVFLWLTYASAYKGFADTTQLRNVSGTYYANYIISYVGAILVLVLGVIMAVAFGLAAAGEELMSSIFEELEFAAGDTPIDLLIGLLSVSAVGLFAFFALVGVGIILVLKFAVKPTHSFIQSIYKSLEKGEFLFCSANTAKNWLLISGILNGASALFCLIGFNIEGVLSSGSAAAASIIGSILIDKYFLKTESL